MEAKCSSEMSIGFQRTTRYYIPEDRILQFYPSLFLHSSCLKNCADEGPFPPPQPRNTTKLIFLILEVLWNLYSWALCARVTLKWLLNKHGVRVRTGFNWPRLGTSGWLLWAWKWTFRFRGGGGYWLAEQLIAYQAGFCSVELDSASSEETLTDPQSRGLQVLFCNARHDFRVPYVRVRACVLSLAGGQDNFGSSRNLIEPL
jgi:hypothetical protein